jgi:hypothetical protein
LVRDKLRDTGWSGQLFVCFTVGDIRPSSAKVLARVVTLFPRAGFDFFFLLNDAIKLKMVNCTGDIATLNLTMGPQGLSRLTIEVPNARSSTT